MIQRKNLQSISKLAFRGGCKYELFLVENGIGLKSGKITDHAQQSTVEEATMRDTMGKDTYNKLNSQRGKVEWFEATVEAFRSKTKVLVDETLMLTRQFLCAWLRGPAKVHFLPA
jgi:hypothetical protein